MAVTRIRKVAVSAEIKKLLYVTGDPFELDLKLRPASRRRVQDRQLQEHLRAGIFVQAAVDHLPQ